MQKGNVTLKNIGFAIRGPGNIDDTSCPKESTCPDYRLSCSGSRDCSRLESYREKERTAD